MSPRNPAASRQRLIETAATLFYRRGLQRTSIDEVVAEAGLTKPTLYRHFRSKDELVAAVVEFRSINWAAAIEARADGRLRFSRGVHRGAEFPRLRSGQCLGRGAEPVGRRTQDRQPQQAAEPRALASALSLLFEGAIVQAYVESDPTAGREARRATEQLIRSQR